MEFCQSEKVGTLIKISRLVQELLNFGVLGSLQLWGGGWVDMSAGWLGMGGWECGVVWGCPHKHTHMHAHIHAKHDNFNCKWLPLFGESLGIPHNVICMCMCVGALGISQNSITL